MKVKIITLGCKVNHYDSQSILQHLTEYGYQSAAENEPADVVIVNTCAVTNESERKSRQMIRHCREQNPGAVVVVTGCMSELAQSEADRLPAADIITGTQNREAIPALIEAYLLTQRSQYEFSPTDSLCTGITHFEGKTRATLKIQDGCTMYCTYCIIPYARNRTESMPLAQIVTSVNQICEAGYLETVLTGIHLASYMDRDGNRLIDVLEAIDAHTPLRRLRLGSLEPKLLSRSFLKRLSDLACFCPHFHLSLQSGSDAILKRMNRKYTTEEYSEIVREIRSFFPEAMITTDVIVGFPGETEVFFEETLEFVRKIRFAHVHVFPYSPKKGTPAASYEQQISKAEKHRRVGLLMQVVEAEKRKLYQQQIGTIQEVLTENTDENGYAAGYSRNYLKVAVQNETEANQLIRVRIIGGCAERLTADKIIDFE
ncbi:MAG: tRNA (N(6)-L-threonylcarbamoyladenosine(37)-C(2))-methylthiotransferase MtaB [Anaerofustis sp.]